MGSQRREAERQGRRGGVSLSIGGRGARGSVVLLPLALLLLTACAHLPPPAVDCDRVEAQVAAAAAAWEGHAIAGTVELTAHRGLARQRARAALLLLPPDRLRAELLGPLGTAQAVAVVDGDDSATWTPEEGWRRQGDIGPIPAGLLADLPRLLLGLPAPAATCLPGEAPPLLVWEGVATYRWDARVGRLHTAHLAGATVRYRPQEPDRERSHGGGAPRPPDLDITLGDGATVAVRWQGFHPEPALDPTLFTLPPSPPAEAP